MIKGKQNYVRSCDCGFNWTISRSVIHRLLNCPDCGNSYWFEANPISGMVFEKVGKHKSKKQFEKRLKEWYGKRFS